MASRDRSHRFRAGESSVVRARHMRCFILLLTAIPFAFAQVPSQISGIVRDPSGASVGEVSITVMNLESGVRRTARTALDGSYGVSSLPAGKYKVMVRKHGFRTMARLG